MSRRYAPDHKSLVLKILRANKLDVAATSRFTGVPQRTLRDWLRELPPARSRLLPNATTTIAERRL